jgi:hypothetical protein
MLVFGVGLIGSDIILREVSAPISNRRGPEFAEKQPTQTTSLDIWSPKNIRKLRGPTSHNFLAFAAIIADSAKRTLVVDRRSAVGTSLPQAASKRALPVKTRQ